MSDAAHVNSNIGGAILQFGKPIVDRFERALADGIARQFDYTSIGIPNEHGDLVIQFHEGELNLRELAAFIIMEKRFE